jgi:hypothetical protein
VNLVTFSLIVNLHNTNKYEMYFYLLFSNFGHRRESADDKTVNRSELADFMHGFLIMFPCLMKKFVVDKACSSNVGGVKKTCVGIF